MGNVVNDRPPTLDLELQDFVLDRQVRNLSKKTIAWYRHSLEIWRTPMVGHGISTTTEVTPGHMRRFLLSLTDRGHNPGVSKWREIRGEQDKSESDVWQAGDDSRQRQIA